MTAQSINILDALQNGSIELRGEFLWGSNYTFLATVRYDGEQIAAVYKPSQGVRPLWDFPKDSLAKREVAAYLVGEALNWHLVPPTFYRDDAPLGPGSLQLFIEHDPEYHYFRFSDEHLKRLRPVVLFDIIINNADRKGSHVLIDPKEQIWLIDHGLCFHVEEKIRTVIWNFKGEPIPGELIMDIRSFSDRVMNNQEDQGELVRDLQKYLSKEEISALGRRAEDLIANQNFPGPDQNRRYFPWPEI
jgi:uncharacterized repeat protein (TIGR03843 family)